MVDDGTELMRMLERLRPALRLYSYLMVGSQQLADRVVADVCSRAERDYAGPPREPALRLWLFAAATELCTQESE